MSTPQSIISICSGLRINNSYDHTIYFATQGAQLAYFAGKVVKTYSAYTFLRKTWPLKVEATMEEAMTWNYLYFMNGGVSKVYFYFINQIEYINDNTVELRLELDVMQTYMFDYTRLPCFVERQHTTNDNIISTIDEGMELGEYVNTSFYDFDLSDLCIMIMATINPAATTAEVANVPQMPYCYNGVFSGIRFWAVDGADWVNWGAQLQVLEDLGVSDGIISMWMYPKAMVVLGGGDTWSNTNLLHVVERAKGLTDGGYSTPITRPQHLNYYFPRNRKLLGYPFNFIYATNNQGNSAVYKYEFFATEDTPGFRLTGSLGPDGGVRLVPEAYKMMMTGQNYDEGLTLTGFPTCSWDSDMYKIWLAQNQNTHKLNQATSGLKIAAGVATAVVGLGTGSIKTGLAGGATIANGMMDTFQHLAQKRDMDIAPPQSRGSFSSSVNVTNKKHTFTLYQRCIDYDHAKVIDDYFSMYGYKVNGVQVPNICAREKWTYIKTVGCHIAGNLCNEDIVKIEGIYDKGITFWVDGDTVGEYMDSRGVFYDNPIL